MARKYISNIELEGATILWPNFSGRPGQFNREGDRSFNVRIDDAELAQRLTDDGWGVKILAPLEEGEKAKHHLQVKVRFNNYPPTVYMVIGDKKFRLDENSIDCLDKYDIKYADVVISPYSYKYRGEEGISAYLKSMYVVIDQDPYAHKYADYQLPTDEDLQDMWRK